MKKEQITIDKDYYEFLVEKAIERCQLYSDNRYLRYKLAQDPCKFNSAQWKLYYDFVKYNWYPLSQTAKNDEMEYARIMACRTEEQERALKRFQEMNKEREGESNEV